MSGQKRICVESILDICNTYGFSYRKEGDSHLVSINGVDEKVKFDKAGSLYKGPNRFMNAARAADKKFAADYPARTTTGNGDAGKNGKAGRSRRPVLSEKFFLRYSHGELKAAQDILPTAVKNRRVHEEMRVELGTIGKKLATLEGLVSSIKDEHYEPPEEMIRDVSELTEKKKKIEDAMNS